MQQHSIILAPNYLVSIQAGEDNHFSVWLRRIPPLVFWHCTAPRCGISKFISFTTEPNEGSCWCKHRRGAAKTDMEPTSITTDRDGEPRKRFLILNSLYSSTTAKKKKTPMSSTFSNQGKSEKSTHYSSAVTHNSSTLICHIIDEKIHEEQTETCVNSLWSVFAAVQLRGNWKRNSKNNLFKRHIFLISSSFKSFNCIPVVPLTLSKCNESCCLQGLVTMKEPVISLGCAAKFSCPMSATKALRWLYRCF